ncbi:MAG: aminoacyl-tRNA hydrolase [Acidobacteriaceae bacterium]|nr:aminoacyl-tRNA hydrolase [Acidobacteriaceae bacterium]MBV9939659.1 aminoacyl-tRNA hydrolase [Acidobacteriaceae bacterium]
MSEGSGALPASSGEPEVQVHCIAGLGNPGSRYERTPHNVGFWVLDELGKRWGIRISKSESETLTGSGKIRNKDVILVKPQTFMNLSGVGISAVLRYRKLTSQNLIAVYDELDLPWTALRIKTGGSAAGHNGVKSIISALKTDVFTRVRVGIRPDHPVKDAADYVLAPLERELAADVEEMVSYTADAVESIVAEGASRAMTKFNRRARGIQKEDS